MLESQNRAASGRWKKHADKSRHRAVSSGRWNVHVELLCISVPAPKQRTRVGVEPPESRHRAVSSGRWKDHVEPVCGSTSAKTTHPSRSRVAKITAPTCVVPLKMTHPSLCRAAEMHAELLCANSSAAAPAPGRRMVVRFGPGFGCSRRRR